MSTGCTPSACMSLQYDHPQRFEYTQCRVTGLVLRTVIPLARISALDALPRLLTAAAGQTACLVNVSEPAAPFQASRPTIREYLTLLSRIFLLDELPAWHSNRLKRLVKTPKLHMGDTGLADGVRKACGRRGGEGCLNGDRR